MGMSCFLVQKCTRVTNVSCFSVQFCSQLSPISCFACIFYIFYTYVCDSMLMQCSLWQAVPESSWYFNTILWYFLRAVYGNVVFLWCVLTSVWCFNAIWLCFLRAVYGNVVSSRSKMHARHKSLVFFRSLLLPAVANLMFCFFLYVL